MELPPPPRKERFIRRLRRLYRSRAALRPVTRWLVTTGIIVLLVEVLLFVLTSIWTKDPGTALKVATTVVDPFSTRADLLAVPLLVLSVFLIPAFIGAAAAAIVEEQMARMRNSEKAARRRILQMVRDQEVN